MDKTYEALSLLEETMKLEDFLKMSDSQRENIKYCNIIPPKLGSNSFGKIKVIHKRPVYMVSE